MNWNVVTAGAQMNEEDLAAKKQAAAASQDRRRLKDLQRKLDKERRLKEKLQRMEIESYEKQRGVLLKREFDARMERKPRFGEVRGGTKDLQRRRHNLRELTRGDFTSIEKPAGLGKKPDKLRLEPVLQHWMPQFEMGRLATSDKSEEHRANLQRQKQVKAAVQKQRWMRMMNSDEDTGFEVSQLKNVMKGKTGKQGPALGVLSGLMKTQTGGTAPDSFAMQQLKQAGGGGGRR
ncbi:hypothetical protein TeGR_g3553 [Tetraparma gracilis]|uniref:Ribosome biogenesis protein NOP53 n=1 Tax=Tetraparma gracilis TaxID=2962635 RepID=A0ABQ6N634_9STRA|nr:hypothetical protein TeGR_g3553 [Tetraparma gracilis]